MHKETIGPGSIYCSQNIWLWGKNEEIGETRQPIAARDGFLPGNCHRETQNRCPSDVANRSHGSPLDKEETSSCHVMLAEEQQADSSTRPDVRPKEIAATASTPMAAGVEHTMHELPVPRALQAFFWWVSVMMRYIPESTQIKALNAAKSTICDMLSEVMANTAVPPGLEAVFAQPVMTTLTQPLEDRDM